jgi:hypothetical protein
MWLQRENCENEIINEIILFLKKEKILLKTSQK